MSAERGDIVLVRFPFSEGTGAKLRPVMVLQCDRNNRRMVSTIVAMISTTTRRAATEPTQSLIELKTAEGRQAGLLHTSAVKCENLFTVHQDLIQRTIGRLSSAAMDQIGKCVRASLGLK